MVLILAVVNYFGTLIGCLVGSSVEMYLGKLIVTLMGHLIGNNMGYSLEELIET